MLDGRRVLDLTGDGRMLCGKILGDLGADVIQIEPPGGSPIRASGPFYHDTPDPEKGLTWFFLGLNKRGITLNLRNPAGREVFRKLLETADFVIEGFAPGYMASLGLGYRDLAKASPATIVTSITPFGQTGPRADYKAPDLVGVSLSGMVRLFGEYQKQPNRISAPQFHLQGGLHSALGSMMAHYHRELTGEGQHVDVSCQQAVVLALRIAAETWDILRVNPRGGGPHAVVARADTGDPVRLPIVFPCKDGHLVAMVLGGRQITFIKSSRALVAMANRAGMALELKDYAWEEMDFTTITQEDLDHVFGPLRSFFLTQTKAELLAAAVAEEIFMMPVNTAEDIAASPQLAFREYWQKVAHPELGDTITYPGWPVHWTDMPAYQPQRRAPLVGEHNRDVYQGELGLSAEETASLQSRGVI